MEKAARRYFNENWTPEAYGFLKAHFEKNYPGQLAFRVSESPIFLGRTFINEVLKSCDNIVNQISSISREAYRAMVPTFCQVPDCPDKPQMLCIDFGICEDESGRLSHKLIELQAFPSLFFYQYELGLQIQDKYGLPPNDGFLYSELNPQSYIDVMSELILSGYAPEEVILMDLFPEQQKTRIDFVLTQKYLGIPVVCATRIISRENKLYYFNNGGEIQIKRIYNRVILDELFRLKDVKLDFAFHDPIEVEWITHPEWFYRVSKNVLPLLSDPSVPKSYPVNDMPDVDLSKYVLKPLYSFSGQGININPTQADIDHLENPADYLIQEKVKYAAVFEDLQGLPAKAELRILMIWPKTSSKPIPVINLVRMTKSELINVDHNKADLSFTGSSVALTVSD